MKSTQIIGAAQLDRVVRSLSPRMSEAFEKLSKTEWLSPYELREKLPTLQGLVSRGLAVSKGYGALGASFSPRTTVCFKLIPADIVEEHPTGADELPAPATET